MSTNQRDFVMNDGALTHPKERDFDLRCASETGDPVRGGNCDIESQLPFGKKTFFTSPTMFDLLRPHRGESANGTCESGNSSAKNGIDTAGRNNFDTFLRGSFSTPLTTSPSKFIKRPLPSTTKPGSAVRNNRQSDFEGRNSFSSPPMKKVFSRHSHNQNGSSIFGSPSTSNSSMDNDDPFASRPVPIAFMFDCSPIAPFFTNVYCFSNHFRCASLIIDGQRYICTEQYYMFYKARVFGDKRAMRQIMGTDDPKLMKKIGINVEGFDQEKWYKVAIQVMVIASVKKFEQNPELRRQLFETSGADLIEANPTDQRWGVGLGMGDWRIREKHLWKGLNWLGRLLTMLRDKLLERPEFAAEKQQLLCKISTAFEAANSVGCLQRIGAQKEGDEVDLRGEAVVLSTVENVSNSLPTHPSP